ITTTSPTPQGAAVVAVPSFDRHHDGGLAANSPYSSNKSNQSITKLNISQYGRCNHHAWKSKHEIGGCISPIAAVVANLPSTARHGGGSGWKSRRCGCCGGLNSGVVVYDSLRLWAATKVATGCHGDDKGGGSGVMVGCGVVGGGGSGMRLPWLCRLPWWCWLKTFPAAAAGRRWWPAGGLGGSNRGRYDVYVPVLTKDHEGNKIQYV
nr:hypothetical protein [Tanacetum cinerariifolium]